VTVTRAAPLLAAAAVAIGFAAVTAARGATRLDPFARARPAARGSFVAAPIDPDTITTSEPSPGVVEYHVPLADTPAGPRATLEIRFRAPLDGARVSAVGAGPRTRATLLRDKRVGGDTVVVPLGPARTDAVEVRVHRHLRPPPILRDVALLAVSPPAAGPPSATSPRWTR
jgi:hypothetical protein